MDNIIICLLQLRIIDRDSPMRRDLYPLLMTFARSVEKTAMSRTRLPIHRPQGSGFGS